MRVVMGGEALEGPLTGIGQYTFHLASQLLTLSEIESLDFLVHGRIKGRGFLHRQSTPTTAPDATSAGELLAADSESGRGRAWISDALGKTRSIAAKSKLAVNLYERVIPVMERRCLRAYGQDDIFHSPNYMLPEFPGHTVVSILDLSTYRYPEHHPEARVSFVNRHIERAIARADHIITISEFVKAEIVERFNLPEARISVTHLGADQSFHPRSEESVTEHLQALTATIRYKSYFLFTSSIEPRKNLDRVLDAYLAYRESTAGAALPLIVTGTAGWKSQHTHRRLEALQNQGLVLYLGYVSQQVLPFLVAGARAVVYPSLYEGFGLPVLEAMQSGTATLTSRDSSMAEVAGDASLLVNPLSIQAIADALATLAADEKITDQLVTSGLARARQFSWATCARQTLQVYSALE